jgi:RNA polymerase sigma-70 factor (ECF subfamily)
MRDSDSALLKQLQAHDEDAVAALVDAYGTKIYQLAYRYLRNKEDAEEVAQDVLFKVYRSAGDFRGDAALSSWVYRITFNTAMSMLRTGRLRREQQDGHHVSIDDDEAATSSVRQVADQSEWADERIFRQQVRQRIMHAVLSLPAIYRAPVMLRDIQGLSTEEASAVLHVKDQTLKSRLHRGRTILRRQLAEFASGLSLQRPIFGT